MPRSIVLGRPLPAPGEPLWLDEDTELALQYLAELKLKCSGCGNPRDESMDPDLAHVWASGSAVCYACAELDAEKRSWRDVQNPAPDDLDGRLFYVTKEVGRG